MSDDCPDDCEICDGQGGVHDVLRERDEARAELRALKAERDGLQARVDAGLAECKRLGSLDSYDVRAWSRSRPAKLSTGTEGIHAAALKIAAKLRGET